MARKVTEVFREQMPDLNIKIVEEYAREFIGEYGGIECLTEQYWIYHRQLARETHFTDDSVDALVTDSPVHVGFLYALNLKKSTKKDVGCLTDLFREMSLINLTPRYDIVFYLSPLDTVKKDGIRDEEHFSEEWRNTANEMLISIFRLFPPKHLVRIGPVDIEQRTSQCMEHITAIMANIKETNE